MTKPDIPRYVDADWVLLQAHKLGESNRPHPFPPSPTEQSHQSEKKRSNGWMPKLYSKKSSHSELIPSLSIESSSSHPNDNDSASSAPAASPVDSASETTGPSLNGSYSPTANTLAANTSANANFSASIYLLSPRDSESDNKNGKAGKTLLSRLRSGAAGFFTGRKPSPKPNSPPKFTADSTPSIGIISASDRVSGDFSGINRDSTEHVHSTDIVPVIAESTVNVDGNGNNISNNSDNKASSSSSSSNLPSNPLQSQISASRVASVARRRRSSATSVADDETLITTRGSLRTMRDRPSSLYMKEPLNFNPAFDEKDSPAYIWLHKSAYLRYIPSTWEKLKDVATKNNLSTTLVVVAVLVGVAGVSYQLSHNQSIIQK